jgi:hypothetical protein
MISAMPACRDGGLGLWLDTTAWFCLSGMIVLLGVCVGHFYLAESRHQDHFHTPHRTDLPAAFANWDGQWYAHIARAGYSYDPSKSSSVAFFPAFPLVGRWLAWATGLPYDRSLTLAANVFFFLALALFADYLRRRPDSPSELILYAPLALALFPVGFFFRMAYSESLFVLLSILVLYGLESRWPIWAVASLVGLTTATRAVGVALIAPLLLADWRRYPHAGRRMAVLGLAAPLCLWGLAAFMIFQSVRFDDPLALFKTHEHWRIRKESSREERLLGIATFEPLWSVFDDSSPAYWRRHDQELGPIFSLQFANPIYFTGIILLVGYGTWRRWLSVEEVLFAAGALLIPYLLKGFEGCMQGQARYAMVAFPAYVVIGRMLVGLPPSYAAAFLSLSGFLLGTYSALFSGWFLFI